VRVHDAGRILSHCAWIKSFGPVCELMAAGGWCASRRLEYLEEDESLSFPSATAQTRARGPMPIRSVTRPSKCWTGGDGMGTDRLVGEEGFGKREMSVQSLGRVRGGRCSVPRPKVSDDSRRMHTERV